MSVTHEYHYNTVIAPLITEKATGVGQYNQHVFKVAREATKAEIKAAVEKVFEVEVDAVRVINMKAETIIRGGRKAKRKAWKKAYVTCKEGSTIQMLDE